MKQESIAHPFMAYFNPDRQRLLRYALFIMVVFWYLYATLAYNLQFYTNDARYIQFDMTRFSLSQWHMSNYRVSSSFGNFLFYPLIKLSLGLNQILFNINVIDWMIQIVPMMYSKLVHSLLSIVLWLWAGFQLGTYINRQWGLPKWTAIVGFGWSAMIPINIFLVKVNNYDSIYATLSWIGLIYLLEFIRSNRFRFLLVGFLLISLALQEKFSAFPLLFLTILVIPFWIKKNKSQQRWLVGEDTLKAIGCVFAGLLLGAMLPTILRCASELLWMDGFSFQERIGRYNPFTGLFRPFFVAKSFLNVKSSVVNWFFSQSYFLLFIGILGWFVITGQIKEKLICVSERVDNITWQNRILICFACCQIFFFVFDYLFFFYSPPATGIIPQDIPAPGTYIPTALTDSIKTFYNGAGRLEYIFIQFLKNVGFYRDIQYSVVLFFLYLGPFLSLWAVKKNIQEGRGLLFLSACLVLGTMVLVLLISIVGVNFGGRYTNLYQILLGMAAFFNFLFVGFYGMRARVNTQNRNVTLIVPVIFFAMAIEMWPYAPSYQAFGNIFHPKQVTYGWGEASSALVQAGLKNKKINDCIKNTYTTYTGLAIAKPFRSPLINFRLIQSRQNPGKRRDILYFLIERAALGQNKWLKDVLLKAQKTNGAIVWAWNYPKEASAWLVQLDKMGIHNLEMAMDLKLVERHHTGEWEF